MDSNLVNHLISHRDHLNDAVDCIIADFRHGIEGFDDTDMRNAILLLSTFSRVMWESAA